MMVAVDVDDVRGDDGEGLRWLFSRPDVWAWLFGGAKAAVNALPEVDRSGVVQATLRLRLTASRRVNAVMLWYDKGSGQWTGMFGNMNDARSCFGSEYIISMNGSEFVFLKNRGDRAVRRRQAWVIEHGRVIDLRAR